ncbi:hypothetical protein BYT27DRAFT_7340294 [Phlegmacium glaucopus]|nr:hypothetical protein BYT27DRAFT_7340294 [Phlegmacium glaucopus]
MKFALLSSLALVACLVHAAPVQLPRVLCTREVNVDASLNDFNTSWVRRTLESALVGREVDLDLSNKNTGNSGWIRRNPESALVRKEVRELVRAFVIEAPARSMLTL